MRAIRLCSKRLVVPAAALFLILISSDCLAQDKCLPVSDELKKTLTQYVHKKLKLPPGSSLAIADVSAVGNTCYRKLRFEGASVKQPIEFELFLSPDRRYLSRDLSDSFLDPVLEEQQKAEQLRAGLVKATAPSLGPKSAAVDVVVFSDFECPFCKNAARMIKEIASLEGTKVRFLFRH